MFLIVGLGNPGDKYKFTRHNIGFRAIDILSNYYKCKVAKKFKKSLIGEAFLGSKNILLMKPLTYMNLSGSVILSAITRYKIKIENLIVIYDDLDLPLGKVRIRKKGGAGGHKGVLSIINSLNNDKFIRIRIGIKNNNENIPSEIFVLSNFTEKEEKIINNTLIKLPEIVETIINFNVEKAMNDFN